MSSLKFVIRGSREGETGGQGGERVPGDGLGVILKSTDTRRVDDEAGFSDSDPRDLVRDHKVRHNAGGAQQDSLPGDSLIVT